MYSLVFLAAAAFIFALALTPVIRNLFRRWGVVDHPDRNRKLHQHAVPRIGGVPVALAYVLSFALLLALPLKAGILIESYLPLMWRLLPAVVLILAVGVLDDIFTLKPWQKLLGQVAAASAAFWAGIHLSNLGGYQVGFLWSFPLTVGWLILCTNALNLIDGLDGLAAGVGFFAAATILLAALLGQNVPLALATAPLAGALLGFLRYNFNPATIFLGDSGSLFVGFLLGCFGAVWSQKATTILGMTAPLMALSIPLLDTALAITRRFLRHQPIFGGDRGHIHHRLLDRGLTPRRVALLLYGCCLVGALCSLSMLNTSFSGLAVVVFCLTTWIGIQHLGYVEFGIAGRMFIEGAFRRQLNAHIELHTFEQRLAAALTREACWEVIVEDCSRFGFHSVEMEFSGRLFQHRTDIKQYRCWNIRVPISDYDYVELARAFDEPVQSGAVSAFVDVLRRTLAPKLATFDGARPQGCLYTAAVAD